jgi:putative endonuclease
MNYYVYMLIAENSKISYVGYTNNISKRILLHNSGRGAKFTRGRKWKLIYKEKFTNKSDAMKNEIFLKKNLLLRNKIKLKYFNSRK